MQDYEKLGSFYLGRKYDLAAGKISPKNLLYDSKDLTTHAVCVGMTGSGKTGLCLSLLEEAGLDGIPAIAIDPKGDLGNLLLTFPELRPSDFRPWIDPSTATRKGITPDELAAKTAAMWRKGLADWGQEGERIGRYNHSVEKTIYTPGSSAGVPLTVLKSFNAPSQAVLQDSDAMRDRIQSTASGVLALLGIDADPVRSREHILLSRVLDSAWRAGRNLDLPSLIREIQKPGFDRLGVLDLESFFPASDRHTLGMQLNNLLASPSFASWLEGEPLDVQRLLYTRDGRPRLSILSIAHLSDTERMFFVTILLNEVLSWMRSQPGTSSLRAILYMDEVYGYFPPVANPPSKRPMLTLLKQARAYGLGCVLATQNPVDLDYKGLSNTGTWLLGRLQTERDKARVLEGLEGASAQAGASFDRGKMEQTLARLGSRVFLMNNVHENKPKVFHTRWAMSYLRGPLTRNQIRDLMRDRKAALQEALPQAFETTVDIPVAKPADQEIALQPTVDISQPLLSANIQQKFWPLCDELPKNARLQYRPALTGTARLHFVRASYDVDFWQASIIVQPVHEKMPQPMWSSALTYSTAPALQDQPQPLAEFGKLPSELAQEKNYANWEKELKDHLYRTEKHIAWRSKELDEHSEPGESEGDFRIRMSQRAREQRDDKKEDVRKKFQRKIDRAEKSVKKAEDFLQLQKSQFWTRILGLLWMVLDVVLGQFTGRKSRRRVSSSSANQAIRERGEQSRARIRLEDKQDQLEELQETLQDEIEQIDLNCDPKNLEFEKLEVTPRKSDVAVEQIHLVWLPWRVDEDGFDQVAY